MNALSLVTLLLTLGSESALSEEPEHSPSFALISGVIRDVDYIGDMQPEFEGDVPMGSHFEVKLLRLKALRGDLPSGVSSFELTATHEGVLKKGDKISLLIKIETDRVDVIHWEWPFTATCVPERLWKEGGLDGEETYNEVPTKRRGARSCVVVDD